MIYLDHAATTPMSPEVKKAMDSFCSDNFGNPSAIYKLGRDSARVVHESRESVANILHTVPENIIFTAGGTESINLAILGLAYSLPEKPSSYHFITSVIEHPAVLNSFRYLESRGFQVTYLPVDKFGLISEESVMKALRPETILASIIYANNEIGTVQPIAEIANVIKNYRHIQRVDTVSKNPIFPIFHTDACQVSGYLDINIDNLGVDMMTLNGSKIYGPKQVGILFRRKDIDLKPILFGGEQEFGLRPGTENVAGIVGFAKALELAEKKKEGEAKRLTNLRDYFIMELLKIPDTILNGHHKKRLPNNINVSFIGVEGESVILKLDSLGIYVSSGSACQSMSLDPSHVIMALDKDDYPRAHGSIRFSLGESTTREDLDEVLKVLPEIISDLRKISAIN